MIAFRSKKSFNEISDAMNDSKGDNDGCLLWFWGCFVLCLFVGGIVGTIDGSLQPSPVGFVFCGLLLICITLEIRTRKRRIKEEEEERKRREEKEKIQWEMNARKEEFIQTWNHQQSREVKLAVAEWVLTGLDKDEQKKLKDISSDYRAGWDSRQTAYSEREQMMKSIEKEFERRAVNEFMCKRKKTVVDKEIMRRRGLDSQTDAE